MNYRLKLNESKQLSSHINRLCTAINQENNAQIYAHYEDLVHLAPDLKDDLDENDDEDYKNLKENLEDKVISNDFKFAKKEEKDKKLNKDELIERNMRNRCFMQKFQAAFIRQQTNEEQDNLSNYERLKLKLKKQMMSKSAVKKDSRSIQSSLKKSDSTSLWQAKRNSNKSNKLLDLIYLNKKSDELITSCYCKIEICIPWYPCTVKYCRPEKSTTNDKSIASLKSVADLANRLDRVRCGIKSCKKCYDIYFQTDRNKCLWD